MGLSRIPTEGFVTRTSASMHQKLSMFGLPLTYTRSRSASESVFCSFDSFIQRRKMVERCDRLKSSKL